jgi:hypothetical protein
VAARSARADAAGSGPRLHPGTHLDAYLDELERSFNNRGNPYLFRDTIKKLIESKRVEFSNLTA